MMGSKLYRMSSQYGVKLYRMSSQNDYTECHLSLSDCLAKMSCFSFDFVIVINMMFYCVNFVILLSC